MIKSILKYRNRVFLAMFLLLSINRLTIYMILIELL